MMATTPTPGKTTTPQHGNHTASPTQIQLWHQLYTSILFEAVGVFILAIIADSNEKLGTIIVIVMIGWFLIFLASHGSEIPGFNTFFNAQVAFQNKANSLNSNTLTGGGL